MISMRRFLNLTLATLALACSALAQAPADLTSLHWNQGSDDCKAHPQPPLEVHAYDPQTFLLRENLCSTFEAPFMYLLIGSDKALLIDSGDVADANAMPLAQTVMQLLPSKGESKLPLLVVHSHRHLDHRAGDVQFANLPNVQVVGYDLDSVKKYFAFTDWPNGHAQIDLGGRTVDVVPAPGHSTTDVVYYDNNTGLLFSGDFLMPGRLLVDDADLYLASSRRVADFVRQRPVRYVLGGHIELDSSGQTLPWQSQYHPNERTLPLSKDDVLALPAAIEQFNGFYSSSGHFIMMNSMRILKLSAVLAVAITIAIIVAVVIFVRRWRRRRRAAALTPAA
jgi:hydroxyacylglutathione hydrolase